MTHLGWVRDIFERLSASRFICPNRYALGYIAKELGEKDALCELKLSESSWQLL